MHIDIHNNIFQMSGELTDHLEAIVALFFRGWGKKCHLHSPSFLSVAWTGDTTDQLEAIVSGCCFFKRKKHNILFQTCGEITNQLEATVLFCLKIIRLYIDISHFFLDVWRDC